MNLLVFFGHMGPVAGQADLKRPLSSLHGHGILQPWGLCYRVALCDR